MPNRVLSSTPRQESGERPARETFLVPTPPEQRPMQVYVRRSRGQGVGSSMLILAVASSSRGCRDKAKADATTLAPLSGEEIRALREQAHMSQAVFARHLNLTVGYISQLERGAKHPTGPAPSLARCDPAQGHRGNHLMMSFGRVSTARPRSCPASDWRRRSSCQPACSARRSPSSAQILS